MITKEKIISTTVFIILVVIGFLLINGNNDFIEKKVNKHSKSIIDTQALAIEKSISESVSSTKILAKYVELSNGDVQDFKSFANRLYSSLKGISNLQLAPNGVVSKIYPLQGNEKAIGHELFNEKNREKEAFIAKETKKLTLAGPLNLVQGGVGIVARYPIYIEEKFWGFASTLIMMDKLLGTTDLHKLKEKQYLYRLKRVHPDSQKMHVFSGTKDFPKGKMFSREINLPNAKWYIDLIYTGTYITNTGLYILYFSHIIISALLSYLLFIILNKPKESELQKKELESKVKEQTSEIENNLKTIKKHVIYSKTDLKGVITDVSDAFCKISGYSREELINSPHNIVRHPDNPKSLYKNMWSLLKADKSWKGQLKNLKKDGSFYWVSADISPDYNNKGEKIGYISIRQEISAQKELEKQQAYIIEQDKMASLGQLIGNIAHQWRQPLNLISVSASGIKLHNEMNTLDNKTLNDLTKEIINHTKHLSNTIETFRNYIFAKDSDKENLEIRDILNMIKSTLEDSNIELRGNLQEEKIKIPGSLSHVIVDILNNSKEVLYRKHIEKPWIEINLNVTSTKYMITIEDNGEGVSENILPHIFEPYFTTKHQSQGTGLGLFLSYKIVTEELNGEFYVENTTNGAKSFINVPL